MILSKTQAALVIGALLALAGAVAWQANSNRALRTEVARQATAKSAAVAQLEAQVAAETRRVAAAEARVAALLKDVEAARGARVTAAAGGPTDTGEFTQAVIARAAALVEEGKPAEALQEYVAAYRELTAKRPASSECQRLMGAMKALARTHPPALAALTELRDAAMAKYAAKADDAVAVEAALLNERLGEGARTLALYDALPEGDMARQSLATIASAAFIAARRYADALGSRPLERMLAPIENAARIVAQNGGQAGEIRKAVIEQAATNVEVLAGAGKTNEARLLTEKLLTFDNSEATRALLRQHMARAGGG